MTNPTTAENAAAPLLAQTLTVARNARDRMFRADQLNQAGRTPFDVLHQRDIVTLRHYPALQTDTIRVGGQLEPVRTSSHPTPLVVVPPLAVNMLIYDLFPERSLVKYLRARGFDLYLVDWGRPSRRHNRLHLADYITDLLPEMLERVRRHSGRRGLSLHGWSMGGLFSYAYAALGDADIRNLVLLGAPCDYHAPGGVNWQNRLVSKQMKALEKALGWRIHGSRRNLWRAPGWANSLAFKLASPQGTVKGYTELARNLHDRDFVSSHATNAAFLDDMVAYPGGVIQDIVQYLLTDNVLADGRLPIKGCAARLADIRADMLLVTGDRDPVVPRRSSQRLLELTPQARHTALEVPGGHMSIVSGSQAPATIWPQVGDWLTARSQA